MKKPRGYWTYDVCKKEALKFTNRHQMGLESPNIYNKILRKKWFSELCSHFLLDNRKPNGYWIYKKCKEEALKYIRIVDFKKGSGGAYISSRHNGWLKDVTKHMIKIKPVGFWSKENCRIEALKYNTKIEFKNKSGSAYNASIKNKWINDVSSHMVKIGNRYHKCVYAYEFSDNHVYVGITYNIEKRIHDRKKCKTDSVTKYINKSGLIPEFKQLTDFIDVDIAIMLEEKYVNDYRNNNWIILNQVKTGSVGSVRKWSKEMCINEAKKYENRSDFSHFSGGAYDASRRYGWIDEILSTIPLKIKPRRYWTKEMCETEFKKYSSKKEVKRYAVTAYCVACKNNWLKDFEKYMTNGRKINGYWTKDMCISHAKMCKNWNEFKKNYKTAYVIASRNNWLEDISISTNL